MKRIMLSQYIRRLQALWLTLGDFNVLERPSVARLTEIGLRATRQRRLRAMREEGMTLQEIGDKEGVTRQRVEQLLKEEI